MLHRAKLVATDKTLHYASVDGERFYEVSRPVEEYDRDRIAEFSKVGKKGTLPMAIHRNFLTSCGATFDTVGD